MRLLIMSSHDRSRASLAPRPEAEHKFTIFGKFQSSFSLQPLLLQKEKINNERKLCVHAQPFSKR